MTSPFQLAGIEWLTAIDDAELIARAGEAAVQRAWGYVDAERVLSINTGDRGNLVLATVEGSREHPYSTMIVRSGRSPLVWSSRCSCPMASDCKHVVATILAAREALGVRHHGSGASSTAAWQEFAVRFLGDEHRDDTQLTGSPLGLRVVQTRRPTSVTDSRPRPAYELVASRRSRAQRWTSRLSWLDVHRDSLMGPSRTHDREQNDALLELFRLWQSVRRTHLVSEPQIFLDDLGVRGWSAIGHAVNAGVTLLPSYDRPEASIIWQRDPMRARASFTPQADGSIEGSLRLPVETNQRVDLQGDPAHGVVLVDGDDLVLQAFDVPLSPEAMWLHEHGPLRLDANEAKVVLGRFGDRLRERGLLDDAAVQTPAEPLRLHVSLEPAAEDAVQVEINFRYPGEVLESVELGSNRFGRDRRAERELVERVEQVLRDATLLEAIGGLGWWPVPASRVEGWRLVQLLNVLDELELHEDVIVERRGQLPVFEEATGAPQLTLGAVDTDQPDWLELNIQVTVDGEPVAFTPLYAALSRGEEVYLNPVTKTWIRLDHPELLRLRMLIDEARQLTDGDGEGGGATRINRFQVGLWDELLELGVVDEQASEWARRVEALRDVQAVEAPSTPHGLLAQLRPYQQEGFTWLSTLWDLHLGGILADDMGLGKTVQTLAMLARADERGELDDAPVLVVAPSSVVSVWLREAATFTPHLPVAAITSTNAKRGETVEQSAAGAKVVVTSYTVLRLEAENFAAARWRALILDEAHMVKNHQSKTFQAAKRIGAPFTLVITGTPLENSLMDLWSMLALSAPALFPRPDEFTRNYRKPIELGHAPELLDSLRRRIRPLMLRRSKELVAGDLPPKQTQVQRITLSPRHSQSYKRLLQRERQRVLGLLDDPDANRVAILSSLTRLRRGALDPGLVDDSWSGKETSAKLEFLVEMIDEITREGHRALAFSTFTSYLKMAQQALQDAGHATSYLDGSMSVSQRMSTVASFKEGEQAAFLISMKAGGVGLTLTEADYVFVLDPWWNPAAEAQAIDRAHRIGQENPVVVYRLISEGTIEDKVLALQERKRELFDSVMEDGATTDGIITPDDIRALLD